MGHSLLSSEDLVKACVGSNHEAAWVEFIRRFRPVVAKVVLRRARRWEEPPRSLLDDLIQDTFLKLCMNDRRLLRRFRSRHPDAILGFLKVVATSVVHDHYKSERAQKRDTYHTDSLSEQGWMDRPATGNGNLADIENRLRLLEIDETLMRLAKGEYLVRNRAIFWLHHRDGMTASAIASIPSIGLKTKGVESTLRRMTQMIQSHIGTGA